MAVIDEKIFDKMLKDKLPGGCYERALRIFQNYGKNLSWDVTNVLLWAVDNSPHKIVEVFEVLEEHWEKHLQFQHPEIRGMVSGEFGKNPTQVMFIRICKEVLRLQPKSQLSQPP